MEEKTMENENVTKGKRAFIAFKKSKLWLSLILCAVWYAFRWTLYGLNLIILPLFGAIVTGVMALILIITFIVFISMVSKSKGLAIGLSVLGLVGMVYYFLTASMYVFFVGNYHIATFEGNRYWLKDTSWTDIYYDLYEYNGPVLKGKDSKYVVKQVYDYENQKRETVVLEKIDGADTNLGKVDYKWDNNHKTIEIWKDNEN